MGVTTAEAVADRVAEGESAAIPFDATAIQESNRGMELDF